MSIEQLLMNIHTEQQRTNTLLAQLVGAKEGMVSLEVAAKRLGLSRYTLWRRVTAGEWPSYRVGGRSIRVKVDELEALIMQGGSDGSRVSKSAQINKHTKDAA